MDLIDTSPLSLSIGGIVAVVVLLITKYLLENRNKDLAEEEKIDYTRLWGYSVAAGIGAGILALLAYKQYIIYRANSDILTDNFYS